MADHFEATLDASALLTALAQLGDAAVPFVRAAAQTSAESIVREAQARLARQLGPNASGQTVAGITMRPDTGGTGFIVVAEREPFPNLPLWLEKGTKKGQGTHANLPRPFFYVSAELEEGPHERRISEAVQAAIDAQGLGG